ncbi:MAG: ROK family transcriptional regulator [Clostridiales bacterium]|jgi:predicted NBD/HSP70 family sugar kinase|nr:ROK family transcriptional regulator [Clostridiales bacterium]
MDKINTKKTQGQRKITFVDIKKKNYKDVYNYLYNNGSSSKQRIATSIDMSLPTVTTHLNKLMSKSLVRQGTLIPSNVGRRAVSYEIILDAYISIGVEIIQKQVFISAIDLKGNEIARCIIDIEYKNVDSYYEKISGLLNEFIDNEKFDVSKILGIGFTLEGLVSTDRKSISWGKILENTGLNVEVFQKHLAPDCYFMHDPKCAAFSEIWGRKELKNAIYLSLSHHLGSSIILDGKTYSGAHSMGGIIEHSTLHPDGLACYCGKKGCADPYCSLDTLTSDDETFAEFFERKSAREKDAVDRWRNFLKDLASLINNTAMLLDVEVILGGHAAKYLIEEDLHILSNLIKDITAFPDNIPTISIAKYQSNAIPTGAALIIISEFLENL